MSVPRKATPTTVPHVLRFDGVDDVVTATNVNLTNVHSLRLKVAVLSQVSDHTAILFAGNGIEMLLSDTRQIEVFGSAFVTVGPVMDIGEFYDVCITRNGTKTNEYKVYVDGVLVGSTTRTDTPTSTSLLIGQKGTSASPLLPSHILVSDTCVWNRVLTETEIKNLYYNNVVPQDGLIANYDRLSDDTTLLLDSVVGNNGTITGATRLTSLFGIPKPRKTIVPYVGALQFDGVDDFVEVQPLFASAPNEMTVHGKFVVATSNVDGNLYFRVSGEGSNRSPRVNFNFGSNNITFSARSASGVTADIVVSNILTYVRINQEFAVTQVLKNGEHLAYIDGVLVGRNTSLSSPLSFGTNTLLIGRDDNLNHWLNGTSKSLRVYEKALTTTEVENLVTYNTTPYDNNPTICKLNLETTAGQVDGAVWYDKTANKNNGTISGAVLVS